MISAVKPDELASNFQQRDNAITDPFARFSSDPLRSRVSVFNKIH